MYVDTAILKVTPNTVQCKGLLEPHWLLLMLSDPFSNHSEYREETIL